MGKEAAGKSKGEQVEEGAALLRTLIDWEGSDLKRIYEPLSDQFAYIFTILLVLVFGYFVWTKYKEWYAKSQPSHIPYKVIKPPSTVLSEKGQTKKRICAVVGGTGFVGSHVVDELVRRGDYYVYVLGRTFRPERTNPDADCLIQVDLLDLDGLVCAFQGVDSVINTAAVIPSAFLSADEIWLKNKNGHENVLEAAKKAGVKNLVFLSGMRPKNKVTNREMKAFSTVLMRSEDNAVKANGVNGLSTCAVCPGNIIGLNSPFIDSILSGQMTSSPMNDLLPVSFAPAEYVARALVNAESKLAAGDGGIGGRSLPLRGEVMSWRQFFSLSSWPKKISEAPNWVLTPLIRINMLCVSLFNKAPFGGDLTPALLEILTFVEDDLEEDEVQGAYTDLGVGPPQPPMEQYVKELVERYKQKRENKKTK